MKSPLKPSQDVKYVNISDFSLRKLKCEGNSKRVVFYFPDSEELQGLKLEFVNNAPIPVRTFYSTFRELKRQVYELMNDKK